jgi:hypothetical protein
MRRYYLGENNGGSNKKSPWCLMASLSIALGAVILLLSFLSLATRQGFNAHDVLALGVGFELQIIGVALLLSKSKAVTRAS